MSSPKSQAAKQSMRTLRDQLKQSADRILKLLQLIFKNRHHYLKLLITASKSIKVRRIAIPVILALATWLLYYRDLRRERQGRREIKKSVSQLTMKQFESQAESVSEQQSESESEWDQKHLLRNNTKYCTDVETDPRDGKKESPLQAKRDKIFFDMIGQYKKSGKHLLSCQDGEQSDFDCHFDPSIPGV